MKYFEQLPPEERAEVDAAVHDAYLRDDGTVRPHAEADEIFDHFVVDAVQAHRHWAGVLLDAWRDDGRRAFLKDRWKKSDFFTFAHRGRERKRTVRRGTQVRDGEGHLTWVQEGLFTWTADQLEKAISQCARRIDEERANIVMYRSLLDLLEVTGQPTVRAALEARGVSLEEYLAGRGEAA